MDARVTVTAVKNGGAEGMDIYIRSLCNPLQV